MPILTTDDGYHLSSRGMSYILGVDHGYLAHRYWGPPVRRLSDGGAFHSHVPAFSPNPDPAVPEFSLDTMAAEYPFLGRGDYRTPAVIIRYADGTTVSDFRFADARVESGKSAVEGLPSTFAESPDDAETLTVTLRDHWVRHAGASDNAYRSTDPAGSKDFAGVAIELSYTIFPDCDVIVRSARLINDGEEPIEVLGAASASIDFPSGDYHVLTLPGAWGRERAVQRTPACRGAHVVESRRGASSHQMNPFIAVVDSDATEERGRVYACNLVYSGSFRASVEHEQMETLRMSAGINPEGFRWLLAPGETFQTPEAVLVFSGRGIGEMSRSLHRFYRRHLLRGAFRDADRPVQVNNWEATYFDIDEETLVDLARTGRELGLDLLVMDDGWFSGRRDDTSSLGDWWPNESLFPSGLDAFARRITETGMQFGIWVEPEMISPNSELYRTHPDWCLHVSGRERSTGRNQAILDLSRDDVCDFVIDAMSRVFESAPISYVKWDMNRHMTEAASAAAASQHQGEIVHRSMLGLYRVLETVVTRFPNILFQSCSGGGGRYDPGLLYYMPQVWTSDDTDAVERLSIQLGTSVAYPASTMGCDISDSPNHQVGRVTPLATRAVVAMAGVMGFQMDVRSFSPDEREAVRRFVEIYREIRHLVLRGELYRLRHPGNDAAWMYVDTDRSEAVVSYVRILAEPNRPGGRLRLPALDPDAEYEIATLIDSSGAAASTREAGTSGADGGADGAVVAPNREGPRRTAGGDELRAVGLAVPSPSLGDFQSLLWRVTRRS